MLLLMLWKSCNSSGCLLGCEEGPWWLYLHCINTLLSKIIPWYLHDHTKIIPFCVTLNQVRQMDFFSEIVETTLSYLIIKPEAIFDGQLVNGLCTAGVFIYRYHSSRNAKIIYPYIFIFFFSVPEEYGLHISTHFLLHVDQLCLQYSVCSVKHVPQVRTQHNKLWILMEL